MRAALALGLLLAATAPQASAQPAPGQAAELVGGPASPSIAELVDKLAAAPDKDVAALVAALEAIAEPAPEPAAMPDALFVAARACEERLLLPARALALYDRILAHYPDARVAVAAERRARHLRAQIGSAGASSSEAQRFAQLVASAEELALPEALRRADELAARAWGGAAEVLLWSAELVRRRGSAASDSTAQRDARGDVREAIRRYRLVLERFPNTAEATLAARGLAGAAVEARDWDLAERTTRQLAIASAADEVTRDELFAKISAGRAADRWTLRARLTLALVVAALVASFLHVVGWRPGRAHLRALRPPLELAYMLPVAAVIGGASFTAHTAIAPAVLRILGGGLFLSWLSGATLVAARAASRATPLRTALHLGACAVATIALAYLAIVETGLLDLLLATIRLGPEL